MKKLSIILLLYILCFSMLLIGCSPAEKDGALSFYGSDDPLGEESIQSKTSTKITFSRQYGLQSGELIYTLTNPRLIRNISDLPDTQAENGGFGIESFYYSEKATESYPDFLAEDGSFPSGTYILLIDVTVESQSARAYTTEDLNDLGTPIGLITDPYIFNADNIIKVGAAVNTTGQQSIDEMEIVYHSPTYYSGLGSQEERLYAYRLEPEQNITFTLGYGLSDKNEGGIHDLEHVFISCTGDKAGHLCAVLIDKNGQVTFL